MSLNLTHVSSLVRRGVKIFFALMILYYVVVFFLFPNIKKTLKRLFPPKDLSNPIYGQLDPLEFVEKPLDKSSPKYSLNTKNGRLPANIPNKMMIYKFMKPKFSYQAGKNALMYASALGFSNDDLITDLKGNIYKWRSLKTGSTLEIKIETGELELQTSLAGKGDLYPSGVFTEESASNSAKNIFASIGRFNDSLYPLGTPVAYLGKFIGNRIVGTKIANEAQLARVELYRKINNYPILGPDPARGLLHIIIGNPPGPLTPLRNPEVSAYYWELEKQTNATYPIIPVEDAWDTVRQGKGVVVNVTPKNANPFEDYKPVKVENILVNKVYLAYFETPKFQQYTQPIYVFEGNFTTRGTDGGDITIYFPALSGKYIKPVTNTAPSPTQ